MTIRISLRGDPGLRTGSLRLGDDLHQLATWHRAADGVVLATTDAGQAITYTAGPEGEGTLSMSGRLWTLRECAWDGLVMTGKAFEVPSDQWMAAAFW
jgi:hypothetical protein